MSLWIARRGGAVIAAAPSSAALVRSVRSLGDAGRGAVVEHRRSDGKVRPLTTRRVSHARRIIAADQCPATGICHRWVLFDGYYWHKCRRCGEIS